VKFKPVLWCRIIFMRLPDKKTAIYLAEKWAGSDK
jgi:hypothetical protein